MSVQQITKKDIAGWDSLQDIADSFEKRGLKPRPKLGADNELVLQLADDEFVVLVKAGPGETATDFKPDNRSRHTNLVATNDFEEFTFLTRMRSWEGQQHGRIKHQKISFTKAQFTSESGEKNTVLKKLNSIEYGSSAAIYDTLYDTQQVVKEFYEEFEELRTNLVQEVSGIPDDRGDAKQRYVQVILDRMIFLYFIQEKRLLDRNPNYLHEQPGDVVDDGEDRYVNFYRPLFFDYLAEDKQNPDFGSLPYLNGGLFAKNPVEEEFPDAKLGASADETNELFDDVLEFLSGWNWNVDERLDIVDPKNLSPAILGHIFEQTVNQKEMGAYYTPEEITGFMSRRTIHPYLLDQLNDAVDAEYDEIDDVFGFPEVETAEGEAAVADGGTMTQQAATENVETKHVETLYHDILKEAHVLDPAVGSGAFLLAAQDVLVDIYIQCIEYFQQLEAEGKGWELESRTRDELETINEGQGGASLYAKRTVILNNLYGVDIDEGAVEICKLRLWLSMVADIEDEPSEVEPLPNIDFNIRQGNSLIGFTELVETANDGDAQLSNYGGGVGESVRSLYDGVIEAVKKHQHADSGKEAAKWRNAAEEKIERHSKELDKKILEQFEEADIDGLNLDYIQKYHPFHWVLEFATVYEEGGFDVIIGNPPWDQVQANPDEFFVDYEPTFSSLPSKQKEAKQEELLNDTSVRENWEKYEQRIQNKAQYYKKSGEYSLQQPVVGGTKQPIPNDLSALFFERVFNLTREGSFVSLILPNVVFSGAMGKDLRMNLLKDNTVQSIVGFENKGIFSQVHNQFKFNITVFKSGGTTESVRGIGLQNDVNILRDISEHAIDISKEILFKYSPEARSFPNIRSKDELDVIEKIVQWPPIGEERGGDWYADVYYELRKGYDNDRYTEDTEIGDYPIFEGKNIYQFSYDNEFLDDIEEQKLWGVEKETDGVKSAKERVRERNIRKLKRAVYDAFDGSGSQKQFVNDLLQKNRGRELENADVKLDGSEYRLVFRKISNPTNERTVISAVLPTGGVTVDSVYTLRPFELNVQKEDTVEGNLHSAYDRIFTDKELFAALGLCNSIPFDFLMRTKDAQNLLAFRFEESQMPRLTAGDEWFEYISKRAARLNCYGDEFEGMRERLGGIEPATDNQERREIQSEIDAAAFHAYGLDQSEVKFVLNDFHQVENPRMMDDDYFDLVNSKYTELTEEHS
ncbi:Eco57I restriction-modification methylase domain-containing protein [Halorubrum sp. T3]|uniref:Eco57I restriction-modification methylase domain-containing protein n=1 Tax=Halorubrum sp. T3 TaxID=1194088 RepID=UPI00036253FC|nr:DNA methyltransferase [Halorubrum sp. T3]